MDVWKGRGGILGEVSSKSGDKKKKEDGEKIVGATNVFLFAAKTTTTRKQKSN